MPTEAATEQCSERRVARVHFHTTILLRLTLMLPSISRIGLTINLFPPYRFY
jgi:hypothetical protein